MPVSVPLVGVATTVYVIASSSLSAAVSVTAVDVSEIIEKACASGTGVALTVIDTVAVLLFTVPSFT